jgi:hypothetical protein
MFHIRRIAVVPILVAQEGRSGAVGWRIWRRSGSRRKDNVRSCPAQAHQNLQAADRRVRMHIRFSSGPMERLRVDKQSSNPGGVDRLPLAKGVALCAFYEADLDRILPAQGLQDCDHILLLDDIEHLVSPEKFVETLRRAREWAVARIGQNTWAVQWAPACAGGTG